MKIHIVLSSMVLFGMLSSCSLYDEGYVKFDRTTFDRERTAWQALGLSDYKMRMAFSSDAVGPSGIVTVYTVKNNVCESVEPESPYYEQEEPLTIDELYNNILSSVNYFAKELDAGGNMSGVAMDVKYNSQYHYPEEIRCSIYYRKDICGGGGYSMKLTGFEISN